MFWIKEKFVSLHRKTEMKCSIGLWCNGNTTDSGPVIPGSNPGSPTQHTDKRRCVKMHTFIILRTKPRLSQAGALLLPKDSVSLGIRISL